MPSVAVQPGEFYQWSTTTAPVIAPAEVIVPDAVRSPPPEPDEALEAERLTDRLNAKLAELRAAEFAVQWITASVADLTTLIREGGEHAILLDPDSSRDTAWYGGREIRASAEPSVRIYFKDDLDQMNCAIL